MLNTRRIAFSIAAVVGFITFAAVANAAVCDTDTDCKGDRVCVQGQCASPANKTESGAAAAAVCSKDYACPGDSVCRQGLCTAPHPKPDTGSVPVRFSLPAAGGNFAVRSVETNEQCPVPCALQLSPGFQRIRVEGDGKVTEKIVVPSNGGDFGLRYGISPLLYWGIGVAAVGATLLAVGLYGEATCPGPCGSGKDGPLNKATAGALTGAGAIVLATGAILMLFYKRLELAPTSPPATATRQNHVPQFGVAPTRDGAAMAMSMQF